MALENNQIENSNINNDEISLKELIIKLKIWISYLKSKWKIIFITGLIGGLIGLTIALFEKTKYSAEITFGMEEDKGGSSSIGGAQSIASSFGIDIGGGGGGLFASSNLAELMKSRLIVEKVLLKPIQYKNKTISLVEYYIQKNNLRQKWEVITGFQNIQFPPGGDRSKYTILQDEILAGICYELTDKDKLKINQKDKKATFLSIEVISEDETFSKIFCENLLKETSDFYIETKSKKARINVNVLQRQVDSIKLALNIAISGVASEIDNVYNLNPAFNIKSAPSKKRQIDVQANTALLSNLAVQLEMAKIALRRETPLFQVIDMPFFPLQKLRISKLKFLLIGGFMASFLSILYLISSKSYKKMME